MTTEQEQLWSDLEGWGRDPALSELDALMWRTDRHPQGAWSGVVLQLLDTVPDWERLRAAHEWFVEIVPRFAQRVVDPLVPVGPPMWADDPSFDLDFHLRRVSLPAPGGHRQLLELAQTIGLTPLDRSRPPWEGYLVEGLEDGRAAYVMHAHHVFMDGLALARLHERVLNTSRKHQTDKPTPARKPVRRSPIGVRLSSSANRLPAPRRLLSEADAPSSKRLATFAPPLITCRRWPGWRGRRRRIRRRSFVAGREGCGDSGPWNVNSTTYDVRQRPPAARLTTHSSARCSEGCGVTAPPTAKIWATCRYRCPWRCALLITPRAETISRQRTFLCPPV